MDPKQLFHDQRLTGYCAYCAGAPSTRDHVPAKTLLDEPHSDNLAVVPSCLKCNNDASADEQYAACLIDCIISGSAEPDKVSRANVRRILAKNPALQKRIAACAARQADGGLIWKPELRRLRKVMLKLARGHALYNLSDLKAEEPESFWMKPLVLMGQEERSGFETLPEQKIFPEIGSRAFLRGALLTEHGVRPPPLEWIEVQKGRYRYATAYTIGLTVRIVLSEYLACEVCWD